MAVLGAGFLLSPSDRPPQPTLALTSPSNVTVEGQPLALLCAAPAGEAERRFRFYKGKVKMDAGAEVTSRAGEAELRVAESSRNHTGNFTCGYEEQTEGRWIPSYLSQAVEILPPHPQWLGFPLPGTAVFKVFFPPFFCLFVFFSSPEHAAAPRLAVEPPSGVVSETAPLRLTCVASRAEFRLRFRFYRNGEEIPAGTGAPRAGSGGSTAELLFPRSPRSFGGKFSCGVEEDVGGTWVAAPQSKGVNVTVKDLPSQPALLSDPPSGHVLDGDPLLLTCTATGPVTQRKFAFYKDGDEQFSETITKDRSLFNISVAKAALTTGRFTCRYEEKVNERWIPSPFSQEMMVITQARSQLLPFVAGCSAGAAALLLGLLLVVCLCRRRRGGVSWKGLRNKDDPSTYPMADVNGDDM
ncbi:uncharacterized protein RG961_014911 [Leptosomus discolor]